MKYKVGDEFSGFGEKRIIVSINNVTEQYKIKCWDSKGNFHLNFLIFVDENYINTTYKLVKRRDDEYDTLFI